MDIPTYTPTPTITPVICECPSATPTTPPPPPQEDTPTPTVTPEPPAPTPTNTPVACVYYLDIKPRSCPNPINVAKEGVIPVAIVAPWGCDISAIDPSTIRLEGVAPLRYAYEDVTSPFTGALTGCESCSTAGPDGNVDLTLKFDAPTLIAAILANYPDQIVDKGCINLTLTGNLAGGLGGGAFAVQDVIRIQLGGKNDISDFLKQWGKSGKFDLNKVLQNLGKNGKVNVNEVLSALNGIGGNKNNSKPITTGKKN